MNPPRALQESFPNSVFALTYGVLEWEWGEQARYHFIVASSSFGCSLSLVAAPPCFRDLGVLSGLVLRTFFFLRVADWPAC